MILGYEVKPARIRIISPHEIIPDSFDAFRWAIDLSLEMTARISWDSARSLIGCQELPRGRTLTR